MVLRITNNRTPHRTVYAGTHKTIILLRRNYDQQEGTVRAIKLFECARYPVYKIGQPIQGNMAVGSSTQWLIPYSELKRVGITEISVDDRIIEKADQSGEIRYWQPEANEAIEMKYYESYHTIQCVRIDPPSPIQL